MINRNKDKAITADIESNEAGFSGKAEASIINSDDLKAAFAYDKRDQYVPVTKDVKITGINYHLPFLHIHLHR